MHDRKDSPHKSLQTRNSTSESWAAVRKHPSRSLFDWSCGSTSGFSRSKTTLLLKRQSCLPSPSNNFSCNTTLAVQHHTRSSRQMKGGEWGRHSFAALHAKVSLCHWWNFPRETQDTQLFSSHFWKTWQKFSEVLTNSHENLTKRNLGRKTAV